MKAMSLTGFGLGHVESVEADKPIPGPTELLVKCWRAVSAAPTST